MATEKGIVLNTGPGTAWVRTLPSEACAGCSSCGTCNAQRQDAEVEVINEIGARPGDRILIDIKTSAFLKATFLLYILPIIGLTAGAMLGLQLAEYQGYDASACSAASGFGAFFLTVAFVRIQGNRMGRARAYRPKIIKILPPLPTAPAPLPDRCPV
ncbi:MAG: SoxR reducing system RseC family protein [Desulfobacterales bacterium]|jgi:sigma-E factor negative regulatory protein RseC